MLQREKILQTVRTKDNKGVYIINDATNNYLLEEFTDSQKAERCCFQSTQIYKSTKGIDTEKVLIDGKFYVICHINRLRDKTLKELANKLSFDEKITGVVEIIHTLKRIHDAGFIYNNLNLDNCYLYANNSVFLPCFQSTINAKEGVQTNLSDEVNPLYISPELTGKTNIQVALQSDFYTLGILMYKLFTNVFPFESKDVSELYAMHVAKKPEYPGNINPIIPGNLSQIIMKLLAKNPDQRYKSHRGILYDLEHAFSDNFQLGLKDFEVEFSVSKKIYGREKEINYLKKAIREVEEGRAKTLIIAGYSGVGKSSLVEEINNFEDTCPIHFLTGKFQQYKSNIPYFALVEALNIFFDKLLLSQEKDLSIFKSEFGEKIGESGEVLTSVFPKLEVIVGKQAPVTKMIGIEAENRFLLTFIEFLKIIATEETPLILFLDDLQWTDLVSLNILKAIIKEYISHTFIGLAYRDNEVDVHHPLHNFLEDIENLTNDIQFIKLKDLKTADIKQLLVDSRMGNEDKLANIIHKKTGGNSFFIHRYIDRIVRSNYLHFDAEANIWQPDIKAISQMEASDNIVEFMQQMLKSYDSEVTDMMKTLGVLGHNIKHKVAEIILGKTKDEIKQTLSPAFSNDLLEESHKEFRFTHDKIEQACYQLNSKNALPQIHFDIACLLIENNLCQDIGSLFSLISHLNKGFDYVLQDAKRFFEIYLSAAIKSKEISAYKEFWEFMQKTIQLIYPGIPEELKYKCYSEYHVSLHLNGQYAEADQFFEKKLLNYPDIFALKENYITKVSQDSMLGKYEQATSFGLSILEKLNIHINMHPGMEELKENLKQIRIETKKLGLVDVKDMENIEKKNKVEMNFSCELISAILSGSFFFSPMVSTLLIQETIKLAIKNGLYPSMGYPFSLASSLFILIENNYKKGFDYAQLALKISAHDNRSLGHAKHIFILTCWQWMRPLKDDQCIEIARESFHLLLKGGDIQMSGFIFANTTGCLFERGEALTEVLSEIKKGLDYVRKTNNFHAKGGYLIYEQFLLSMLSGNAPTDNFGWNGFDEQQYLEENKLNFMVQAYLFVYKTQYLYIHKHYEAAFEYALKAKQMKIAITAFIPVGNHYFYAALLFCRKYNRDKQIEIILNEYINQLKQWSEQVKDNWLHKYYLVLAEKFRFSNDKFQAAHFYAKAITTAENYGFTQDLALAQELFSDYWYEQNSKELGDALLEMAYKSYEKWGAKLKLKNIEKQNPQLINRLQKKDIDLLNIIKAQNILAKETNIQTLLNKMLYILIEFSGAERCFLIRKDKNWQVEAFMDIQGNKQILEETHLKPDLLSTDLLNYVARTKKAIIPEEIKTKITDTYFFNKQPKSTLVVPVLNQSEIVNIIYLEHSEIEGLFTENKRQTIELLSSQIAISLVNARLYQNLEERVKQRTTELENANQELCKKNTQLDKVLEELTHSEAQLRESNATKDKFFSIIAHDLKGPMGSIAKIFDLVKHGELEITPNVISTLDSSIQNTYNLLEDMLIWARSQRNLLIPDPAVINVKELIQTTIGVYQLAAEKKNINLQSICSNEDLFIKADRSMTDTILRNLVNNAVKFTPDNGSVIIEAKKTNNKIRISVKDTGIGMGKEIIDSLFRIESKTKTRSGTRMESGTGLGLIVCKDLAELNNGTIGVESILNEGSTLWIEFFENRQSE